MKNDGKKFESKIAGWLKKTGYYYQRFFDSRAVGGISAPRPADFWVFKKPNLFYIECKSTIGANIPFSNFTQLKTHLKAIESEIKCYFFIDFKGNTYAIESKSLYNFIINLSSRKSLQEIDVADKGIMLKNKEQLFSIFG